MNKIKKEGLEIMGGRRLQHMFITTCILSFATAHSEFVWQATSHKHTAFFLVRKEVDASLSLQ